MIPVFIFSLQTGATAGGQPREWVVPGDGGLIGRASECDWVLEDPGRIVSRQHAKVMPRGAACTWTDLGTNSTLLNDRPLPACQPVVLNPGDQLKIGDCLMTFQIREHAVMKESQDASTPPVDTYRMDMFNPPDLPCSIDDLLDCPQARLHGLGDSESISGLFDFPPVLARRMKVDFEVPAMPVPAPAFDLGELPLKSEQVDLEKIRSLLLVSMAGYMRLLNARRLFRQETGCSLTVMSGNANNPLKILSSAEDALQVLLDDSHGVYLPALEAVEQATEDILAHMQASIAHIQSLIRQVQTQLNPAEIEREAQQGTGFAITLPAARKARMWDIYCQHYSDLDRKWS